MTIKEDKAMYVQHNRGHVGHGYGRSEDRDSGNNEERGQTNQQNWHGRGRDRGRSDRSNRLNVECYNCGKYRHYTRDCYAKKRVEKDANLVEKDEGILMMANGGITMDNDMVWYIDTGASNHMCRHKHLFVDIREIKDGHVTFGDSTKVPIKGKGKICFSQKDGKIGTMKDVYYVPDLKNNILSIGRLLEKGFSIFMKDQMLHLKDKSGRMFARVERTKNRMFKLNLKIKTISFRREWKVKDEEEVLKMSKEVQTVETKVAQNKAQVMVKTFLLQRQEIRER